MILNTNSRITSLLCYLYPLLVQFEYHDAEHVRVQLDIDNAIGMFSILLLIVVAFILEF